MKEIFSAAKDFIASRMPATSHENLNKLLVLLVVFDTTKPNYSDFVWGSIIWTMVRNKAQDEFENAVCSTLGGAYATLNQVRAVSTCCTWEFASLHASYVR